jgi:hypothetical protein
MHRVKRAALLPLLLSLAVVGCTSTSSSPSPSSTEEASASASTSASASESASPTAELTPTPEATRTPTPTPPPTPTPAPTLVHGQYLLARDSIALEEDAGQPRALLLQPNGANSHVISLGTPAGPLSPPRYNLDVVWSHNGATVHVIKGCDSQLYDVSALGGPEVLKVSMTNKDQGFLWSPDDKKIAYWHFTGSDVICAQNGTTMARDLMVMNADGSGKKVLVHNIPWGSYGATGWNHDGTSLVVRLSGAWELVNVSDGSTVSLLGVVPATATHVEYSPDGQKIAYVNGGHAYAKPLLAVFATDLGAGYNFAWKPDSSAVMVMGSTLRVVQLSPVTTTTVYSGTTYKMTWSPNGQQIAFLKSSGGTLGGSIYIVAATGGPVTAVPGTSNVIDVKWQP